MTISRDEASQLLKSPPAKCFNESISQYYQEELWVHVISGNNDYSNVLDDASQKENRNPPFQNPDAQILGIQNGVPCPDIQEAPASPCNKHDFHQWGHWGEAGTVSLTEI